MESIIHELLAANSETIKNATSQLMHAYNQPENVLRLCELVTSSNKPTVRQYSAMLLRKRFFQMEYWQMVTPQHQEIIKTEMVNAMAKETEKPVRTAIARLVAVVGKHEIEQNSPWMNDVLRWVYSQCSSPDPIQSECGSSIFATLADAAPRHFTRSFDSACEMFSAALVTMKASMNLTSPVLFNIIVGMTHLTPLVMGHNIAESTYHRAIPIIIETIYAYIVQPNSERALQVFDLLEGMADCTPKLLTAEMRLLVEFCLETANNIKFDGCVRVKAMVFLGCLVRQNKIVLLKLQMLERIIQVVFNMMSSETDDGEDEYFLGDDDTNPMTSANQTMDLLALNVPAEKLLPPLLALVEPALQDPSPYVRRAAHLSMAVVAEGCADAICQKYLDSFVHIILKFGIIDPQAFVQNAAFYALGQFSEHFQPHISKYAPEILPTFFEFLQKLILDIRNGAKVPKHIDRLFYALEVFCENLKDELVPHLPLLMERLFEVLEPNNPPRLRELALSTVSAAAHATKKHMVPYFERLISVLQYYFMDTNDTEIICVRTQAIDTLAALARTIGKKSFMVFTTATMNYALKMLELAEEPALCRAVYNLIAALAKLTTIKMSTVYPMIIERLYKSILSTTEILPVLKSTTAVLPDCDAIELKPEHAHAHAHDCGQSHCVREAVENEYLDEKEEAILALQEFAQYTGDSFIPHLELAFRNVAKVIGHPHPDIRKVSINTLAIFVVALFHHNDITSVSNAIETLIPKIGKIIHTDMEVSIVLSGLDNISLLLTELKHNAIPKLEIAEIIFTCIIDVMLGKVACQFDNASASDDEFHESELDEELIESAGNLLPLLGQALSSPELFSVYFERIYPIIVQKLTRAKKMTSAGRQREYVYGLLADCVALLNTCTSTYFNVLYPIMIDGLNDECEVARQNSVFGLGELVLNAGDKSFECYPQILNVLSQAMGKETKPQVLDNICGAISRVVVTNYTLVPLKDVIPALLKHLPLREDLSENLAVFKCFRFLYSQLREHIQEYVPQICNTAFHVIRKNEFMNDETVTTVRSLLQEIYGSNPEIYRAVANSNPDIALS